MRFISTLIVLLILLCGCAFSTESLHKNTRVHMRQILENPEKFHDRDIRIDGFLKYNIAVVPFLFENKKSSPKDFSNGLDAAIPDSVYLPDVKMIEDGHCVSITGTFVLYNKETIKLDYALSSVGKIIVRSIKLVKCSE